MEWVWAFFMAVVAISGCVLNLLGMPGNWLCAGVAIAYAVLMPADHRVSMGWPVVITLIVLALLGEILEFVAGAAGATKAGGSRRGAVLAVVGALVGGVVGIFAGSLIPIPVLGPLVAALLCAAFGALVGAVLGETWKGRNWQESWEIGKAAFWGRILGTLGKVYVGLIMVAVVLVALIVK